MPQDIDLNAWRNTMTLKQKAEIIADIAVNGFAKPDGSGGEYNKPAEWPVCDTTHRYILTNSNENFFDPKVGHFDWYLFPCHCETNKDLSFEEGDTEFYQEFFKQFAKKLTYNPSYEGPCHYYRAIFWIVCRQYLNAYNNGDHIHIRFEKCIQHIANAYKAGTLNDQDLKAIFDSQYIEKLKEIYQNESDEKPWYKQSFQQILIALGGDIDHVVDPNQPQDIDLNAWRNTMTPQQKAEIIADIVVHGFAKSDGSGGKYKKPAEWPEKNISYEELGLLYNSNESLIALTGDFDAYVFPGHNETYPDLSFEKNDAEFYKELDKQIREKDIAMLHLPSLPNTCIANAQKIIGFYHGNYPNSQSYRKYYEKAVQHIANAYNAGLLNDKKIAEIFCDTNEQGGYTPLLQWRQFDKISKNITNVNYRPAFQAIRDSLANIFIKMTQSTINAYNFVGYANKDGSDFPEKIENLPNKYVFLIGDANGPQSTLWVDGDTIKLFDNKYEQEDPDKHYIGYRKTEDGHEEFYINGITTIDEDPYGVKNFLTELKKKCFQKVKKDKNKPKIKPNPPKLPKIPKAPPYIPNYNPFDDDEKKKDKNKDKEKKQKKPKDKTKDFAKQLEELKKKRQQEEEEKKKQEEEKKQKKEKEDKYNAEMAPLKKQEEEIEAKKPKRRNMTLLEKIIVGLLIVTIIFAIIAYLVIQYNIDKEYKVAMDKYNKDIKDIKNKMNLINKKYGHAPIPMT